MIREWQEIEQHLFAAIRTARKMIGSQVLSLNATTDMQTHATAGVEKFLRLVVPKGDHQTLADLLAAFTAWKGEALNVPFVDPKHAVADDRKSFIRIQTFIDDSANSWRDREALGLPTGHDLVPYKRSLEVFMAQAEIIVNDNKPVDR